MARELAPVAGVVLDAAQVVPGERVLDVACGTGNAALAAVARGAHATAVDGAEGLVALARERAREARRRGGAPRRGRRRPAGR